MDWIILLIQHHLTGITVRLKQCIIYSFLSTLYIPSWYTSLPIFLSLCFHTSSSIYHLFNQLYAFHFCFGPLLIILECINFFTTLVIIYTHKHTCAVDPGYYHSGPVQVQDSNMYEQLSEIEEDEPNAYEVPVSTCKSDKEEWAGDRNPATSKISKIMICFK